jgi:hypothetical protein
MHTAIAIVAVPLGILALLVASGAVYQAVRTARDARWDGPRLAAERLVEHYGELKE